MILRLSTAVRIPVRLLTSTGTPVTGIVPADITNGSTPGHCSVVKADGSITDITLTLGTNFFEISTTAAPGLYHVLLPTGATAVAGTLQLIIQPSATAFVTSVSTAQVDAVLADAEKTRKATYNNYQVVNSGLDANRAIIYEDDGTTVFKKYNLFDAAGNPSTQNPHKRVGI